MFNLLGLLILLVAFAGILIAFQSQILGNIGTRNLGFFAPVLVLHAAGFAVTLLLLPFQKINWRGVLEIPWYLWLCGVSGVAIATIISFAVGRIGILATLTAVVVSQIAIGAILDHFGILGISHPFTLTKGVGIIIILVGLWLVVGKA